VAAIALHHERILIEDMAVGGEQWRTQKHFKARANKLKMPIFKQNHYRMSYTVSRRVGEKPGQLPGQ
jgi:hypothetical protein